MTKRILVTGGAGFIGSHLCERLLAEGHEVVCVDNFLTGSERNIARMHEDPKFKFIRHDVTNDLHVAGSLDFVLHFASAASPVDYAKFGIKTLKANAIGTHKMLGVAKAKDQVLLQIRAADGLDDVHVCLELGPSRGAVRILDLRPGCEAYRRNVPMKPAPPVTRILFVML